MYTERTFILRSESYLFHAVIKHVNVGQFQFGVNRGSSFSKNLRVIYCQILLLDVKRLKHYRKLAPFVKMVDNFI